MAVDSQGIVYVSDPHYGWIQNFAIFGQFIDKFGIEELKDGKLALPYCIAMDVKGISSVENLFKGYQYSLMERNSSIAFRLARSKDEGSNLKRKMCS